MQLHEIQKEKIKNLINNIENSNSINKNSEQNINDEIKQNNEINFQKIKQLERLYEQ